MDGPLQRQLMTVYHEAKNLISLGDTFHLNISLIPQLLPAMIAKRKGAIINVASIGITDTFYFQIENIFHSQVVICLDPT